MSSIKVVRASLQHTECAIYRWNVTCLTIYLIALKSIHEEIFWAFAAIKAVICYLVWSTNNSTTVCSFIVNFHTTQTFINTLTICIPDHSLFTLLLSLSTFKTSIYDLVIPTNDCTTLWSFFVKKVIVTNWKVIKQSQTIKIHYGLIEKTYIFAQKFFCELRNGQK